MKTEIMRLDWISKRFDNNPILKHVNLTLYAGEIHGLIGLNGVGKSTLLQIVSGRLSPDSGQIWFQGKPVQFSGPASANEQGIYMIGSEPMVIPQLDLAENIFPEANGRHLVFHSAELHRRTQTLLETFGLEKRLKPTTPGHQLTTLDRQIVRVLCAAAGNAKLLAIDEPFSVLDTTETTLFAQILIKARELGMTIFFTSHSFHNVSALADRISILRAGTCAKTLDNPGDLQALLELATPIINGGLPTAPPSEKNRETAAPEVADGPVVFQADAPRFPGLLAPLQFRLRAGEILGIVNIGPTRISVCETLFGLHGPCPGEYAVRGTPVTLDAPDAAIRAGIGCVSDHAPLVPQLTCTQNVSLPHLKRLYPNQLIASSLEQYISEQYLDFLALGPEQTLNMRPSGLSTGMQKRLALARWFSVPFWVLMLSEPYKNLDAKGRADLTSILRLKAAEGTVIMMESSNLDDFPELCTRLLVINDHRILGELTSPEEITTQNIFAMILADLH